MRDLCAYCSHAREMHTPECQEREQLTASGERPEGNYVCACSMFIEPAPMTRCNVLHVEDDPDGGLRLYIDEGMYVLVPDGDQAYLIKAQWEDDGVLFIPLPVADDIHEE